ncbi:MAG: coenzyme A pyrophosphatase [Bacteroidetes bacterium]|nr:MAG: coenzyme A pyrophosphatase [Bacteroidota bacterium]
MFDSFIERLKYQLSKELPGESAHKIMSPSFRFNNYSSKSPVKSSVLILLYPYNNDIYTVLIKRAEYDGFHSAQISFPGGKYESSDNVLSQTALRETYEEIGIEPELIKIIGPISSIYIPISNYTAQPFIGYVNKKPDFKIDTFEVSNVINVKISELLDNVNKKNGLFKVGNKKIQAPYYNANGNKIWGATAMVLCEFIKIVKQADLLNS